MLYLISSDHSKKEAMSGTDAASCTISGHSASCGLGMCHVEFEPTAWKFRACGITDCATQLTLIHQAESFQCENEHTKVLLGMLTRLSC